MERVEELGNVAVSPVSSGMLGVLLEVLLLLFCGLPPELRVPELSKESSEYFLLSSTGIFELSPEFARLGSAFMEKLGFLGGPIPLLNGFSLCDDANFSRIEVGCSRSRLPNNFCGGCCICIVWPCWFCIWLLKALLLLLFELVWKLIRLLLFVAIEDDENELLIILLLILLLSGDGNVEVLARVMLSGSSSI